ncbi:hypothetical protein LUZ60_006147 [Juncus effusus]|nr:hypothetical protein LUZ60_006147 [Juncus effusus]
MAFFQQRNLQQQQQPQQHSTQFRNFVPIDGQTSAPVAFFMPSAYQDQSQPPLDDVMGLAASNWALNNNNSTRSRPKEQLELFENSQITSIDFLQTSGVSTGLALSLDDRRAASSGDEVAMMMMMPAADDEVAREVQRMDAEMDRFIRAQSERMRQAILEKVQSKHLEALASVEDRIVAKIRQKEHEVELVSRKNGELEEQIRQLASEVSAWQQRAKYNDSMITALKFNLDQVYAHQSRDNNREGCGDSEVDDTASCCNGFTNISKQIISSRDAKNNVTVCKVCKSNEACMLLLPCRHLCLCKECESKIGFCPLCQSSKILGMEIYM